MRKLVSQGNCMYKKLVRPAKTVKQLLVAPLGCLSYYYNLMRGFEMAEHPRYGLWADEWLVGPVNLDMATDWWLRRQRGRGEIMRMQDGSPELLSGAESQDFRALVPRRAIGITGWSQCELARQTQFSARHVRRWLAGDSVPGRPAVQAIANAVANYLESNQ